MEQLLLTLVSSRNARALLDFGKIESKPAIEHNDKGIAEITDGLSEMLANIARQKGMLGGGEVTKKTNIEKMVRATWKNDFAAADVIQEVMDMLWTSQSINGDKWVRGMLGLKGSKPSTEAAHIAALQSALSELRVDQAAAFAAINRLSNALVDEFGGDEEQAAALTKALDRLHNLAARVNDASIATSLEAVLEVPVGSQVKRALASVDELMTYAERDELMQELDNNEVTPDMEVVAPLIGRLTAARKALVGLEQREAA
jgi:hypothetical protein